jgi:NADH dehydrogenase FAD-containing subunit
MSLWVNCVGKHPKSALIDNLSRTSVSESGHIRVRSTLQIENPAFNNIYAAGDVIQSEGLRNARGGYRTSPGGFR